MTILDEILESKRRELDAARSALPDDAQAERARARADAPRGFRGALLAAEAPAIIAEIKRRSPSKGLIRADFDSAAHARDYERGGAGALSVLTDEPYFGGHLDFLRMARSASSLPVLRKDFTIDAYQIDEACAAGADAVLLIASALAPDRVAELRKHARDRGLDVLVEVHDEAELEVALDAGADLVGVNNRDLRTFDVDLAATERVGRKLGALGRDDVCLVAESGIHGPADILRLQAVGARAFLVGEFLMREDDLAAALAALRRAR